MQNLFDRMDRILPLTVGSYFFRSVPLINPLGAGVLAIHVRINKKAVHLRMFKVAEDHGMRRINMRDSVISALWLVDKQGNVHVLLFFMIKNQ